VNNLGFRARRKRWGVETVHLGIDGGVGERRTEPTPEVGRILTIPTPTENSEGVEKVSAAQNGNVQGGEVKTEEAGEVQVKKKKRATVRFGEDQVLRAPAVSTAAGHAHVHERGHSHDGHAHAHDHTHGQGSRAAPAPRATVRHDRPDLYEF
jgi:elongator complex protein 4